MPVGFLGALGQQAAGQAVGGAVAMGLQRLGVNYDNRKQRQQAQALQDIQISGEKEMIDYSKAADLKMWEDTNYGPQKEQMKAAGINPALLYGMSGGGATTTGGSSPGVGGAHASSPNTAGAATAGMALMNAAQLKLMNAQAENLDANTQDTLAGIPNRGKEGVKLDKESTKLDYEVQDITQGIKNKQAAEQLTKLQSQAVGLANEITAASKHEQIAQFGADLDKTIEQIDQLARENDIGQRTKEDKISQIKEEAIGAALKNILTKAVTKNTTADLPNIQYMLKDMITKNAQGWNAMRVDEQNKLIENALKSTGQDLQDRGQVIDAIRDIIGLGLLMGRNGSTTVPVRGFHNR